MAKRVPLFKVLRRELDAQISAEGFTEIPLAASERTSMLMYFRDSSRGKSLGFWFQRDVKSIYVDALGSSFTIEFFRSIDDPYEIELQIGKRIDVLIDGGLGTLNTTSVVNLAGEYPEVIRRGVGDVSAFE